MKITERMKKIRGVVDSAWDTQHNRLIIYYANIDLNTLKVLVSGTIGDAEMQRAVEKITFILS